MISFTISGIFAFFCVFSSSVIVSLIVSSISFAALMSGISVLYTHTQEIYPTICRGSGAGFLTGVSFFTAVIVPSSMTAINAILGITWSLLLISFCLFLSAFGVYFLEETSVVIPITPQFVDDKALLIKERLLG